MLTSEALAARRLGIGGSDAAKIMEGGEAWYNLWLDKTGRSQPEDLSGVFAVQLGIVTEALNLDWYARKVGRPVTRRGEVVISPEHPILRCTLDGFDEGLPAVIQAKHCNGFTKIDECKARYAPQVIHEMICCQVADGFLSVIVGANEPAVEPIDYDYFFADEYVARCKEFWQFVTADKEPPGAPAPMVLPTPKALRTVDFTGNNEFAFHAGAWIEHQTAAKKWEVAVKGLKAMIEPDVGEASGHGVRVQRDKRGLSIGVL